MAIIVNTNLSSLKTQKNLNNATTSLNKALERMSTGSKINSAKDDAAGMFIATKMSTQINGSKIAKANIETGKNVLDTAEGVINSIIDNVSRIRDLSVQAANGVYDATSRTAMTDEITARKAEIKRLQDSAEFNGLALFSSTAGLGLDGLTIQVGAGSDAAKNAITVDKSNFSALTEPTVDISTTTKALTTIAACDAMLDTLNTRKSTFGAVGSRLESASSTLVTSIENLTAAHSTIMDADVAEESANYTKSRILQQTASSLLVQANALPSIALNLIAS